MSLYRSFRNGYIYLNAVAFNLFDRMGHFSPHATCGTLYNLMMCGLHKASRVVIIFCLVIGRSANINGC